MRVLLIDDEPMVRKIVRKMLERAKVVEAENGRLGIEQLETSSFDLLLPTSSCRRWKGLKP